MPTPTQGQNLISVQNQDPVPTQSKDSSLTQNQGSTPTYIPRLIDAKIGRYLEVFGAISIEGPKWVGKTTTSRQHAKSEISLDDSEILEKIKYYKNLPYEGEFPRLIDEWNRMPEIWDRVRKRCDELTTTGNYLLTCSTKLPREEEQAKIFHSGAGRIGKIEMLPMSLWESGDSSGEASISKMLDGTQASTTCQEADIEQLAYLLVRGGWPRGLHVSAENANLIATGYINDILDIDVKNAPGLHRDTTEILLKSLARNESSNASKQKLLGDITETATGDASQVNRNNIDNYLDFLKRLYIVNNQPAFSVNYRSSNRIGKSVKRHLVDPSLTCALLGLGIDKLTSDFNTFGLIFETMVHRDLCVYMDTLGGRVFHFRDNASGDEVDAILEFADGEYAAVEVKLGNHAIPEAIQSLRRFADAASKKPKFMCVITGTGNIIGRDEATGTYIAPVTTLKN